MMKRRFWFILILLSFGYAVNGWGADQGKAAEAAKPGNGYIRNDIPNVDYPNYTGQRYPDKVPDTLDLAEMARLAINCLTEAANPQYDYDIYFWLDIYVGHGDNAPFRNPPAMRQDCSSWCHMKFAEALPLLRMMCGDKKNIKVDDIWMKSILKCIGPDGLFYWPAGARPYYRQGAAWMNTGIWGEDGKSLSMNDPAVTQFTHPLSGRYLSVMTLYYLRENNPVYSNGVWRKAIEKMIDRWGEILIDKGDYGFFPAAGYAPNAKVPRDLPMPMNITGEECNNRMIQGLAQYYKLHQYEPAKVLGRKLINYMRGPIKWFDEQGRWIDGVPNKFEIDFFHAYTIVLLSMLDFATATGDKELLDFVHKSFHYGLEQKVDPSSTLTGWFPENLRPNYPSCELCGTADMIALAVKLTQAGTGDYWDEVDRWTRNQFAEGQLVNGDWIYQNAAKEPKTPVEQYETAERAVERNVGGWAGWATPNEWSVRNGIMHCCTGNATRALYYVWNEMLSCKDGALRLNLLVNRASPWADVYSCIPYEGRVEIKIKKAVEKVLVRAPQWIAQGAKEIKCELNGKPCAVAWDGRYLVLGKAAAGDKLTLTFPIGERTVKEKIGGSEYTFVIKGTTVVSVDPTGKRGPIYQRAKMRENKTPWVARERFVSSEAIAW